MNTLPGTMRAVVLRGHGGLEQLDYCTVPVPTPGAGEVLIQVAAAALNNTDVNTRIGWYSRAVRGATSAVAGAALDADDGGWTGAAFEFPRIQGADVCGRIVAVGAGVDPVRVGERVLVDPVLRPDDGALQGVRYLGADRDGAFAEYVAVPAVNAHATRSPLSDVELAALPCSGSAAANMVTRAGVRAGEIVLVTGASGGVGSIAVQLCRLRGARVIAVVGSDKAQDVMALGAERTMARDADVVSTLGRNAVDVVIDVVGGPAVAASLDVLRPGGRYAIAGAIAGPRVELDLRTVYLKDLTLYGCTVTPPAVFEDLVRCAASGELRPRVSAKYPLAQIAAAQSAFLEKRHTGKIVLLP